MSNWDIYIHLPTPGNATASIIFDIEILWEMLGEHTGHTHDPHDISMILEKYDSAILDF